MGLPDHSEVKKIKWCDLKCRYARFPDKEAIDGSGSCRTFVALYCEFLKKYVTKNAPCAALVRQK